MKKTVAAFMDRHDLWKENTTILVGVSGGPDSMALLHFLKEHRGQKGWQIIALSVDHGLRGEESRMDAEFVESICEKWGIRSEAVTVDVPAWKETHQQSTQVAAREMRYRYFEERMNHHKADALFLAHHGDDQAETILMRLARGSNPAAVSGMDIRRPFAGGEIIRPMLSCSKSEIQQYCEQHALPYRIDPSNATEDYTRNLFRHRVLAPIKNEFPAFHQHAQRFSEALKADEAYLEGQAAKMFKEAVEYDAAKQTAAFEIERFTTYPIALQRRVYHLILMYLYQALPVDLHHRHEAQFFELIASSKANSSLDFPAGLQLTKSYGHMTVSFRNGEKDLFHYTLHAPGCVTLPDGSLLKATFTPHPNENNSHIFVLPVDDVTLPLRVRTRKNGDKMKLRGMRGTKKVKDIFIDEKIPADQRQVWPIVEDATGTILWLIGLRKGETGRTTGETGSYLCLCYQAKNGEQTGGPSNA
ncbi:tRNA lysidine(34) synthetase TilS [Terribacillus sp. 179-K 1B1 HS]|uniref:tRNA lysidine(34) synthetase TilS n=1 Tax=Terribacillus sp. 179-K 1B1 HS TaxID=3142388 RepID=UPI0039A110C9